MKKVNPLSKIYPAQLYVYKDEEGLFMGAEDFSVLAEQDNAIRVGRYQLISEETIEMTARLRAQCVSDERRLF